MSSSSPHNRRPFTAAAALVGCLLALSLVGFILPAPASAQEVTCERVDYNARIILKCTTVTGGGSTPSPTPTPEPTPTPAADDSEPEDGGSSGESGESDGADDAADDAEESVATFGDDTPESDAEASGGDRGERGDRGGRGDTDVPDASSGNPEDEPDEDEPDEGDDGRAGDDSQRDEPRDQADQTEPGSERGPQDEPLTTDDGTGAASASTDRVATVRSEESTAQPWIVAAALAVLVAAGLWFRGAARRTRAADDFSPSDDDRRTRE